jgi:hypothetical protein
MKVPSRNENNRQGCGICPEFKWRFPPGRRPPPSPQTGRTRSPVASGPVSGRSGRESLDSRPARPGTSPWTSPRSGGLDRPGIPSRAARPECHTCSVASAEFPHAHFCRGSRKAMCVYRAGRTGMRRTLLLLRPHDRVLEGAPGVSRVRYSESPLHTRGAGKRRLGYGRVASSLTPHRVRALGTAAGHQNQNESSDYETHVHLTPREPVETGCCSPGGCAGGSPPPGKPDRATAPATCCRPRLEPRSRRSAPAVAAGRRRRTRAPAP